MNNIKTFLSINTKELSKSERRVHVFVVNNLSTIKHMTITELEQRTFTSKATIERYLTKIGINGFKEFKILVSSFKEISISESYMFVDQLKKNPQIKIAVTAHGHTFLAAQYLKRRLEVLGFNIGAYRAAELPLLLDSIDVIVVISILGEDKEKSIYNVLKEFKGVSYAIVPVQSPVASLADFIIDNEIQKPISKLEHENLISTFEIVEEIFNELV